MTMTKFCLVAAVAVGIGSAAPALAIEVDTAAFTLCEGGALVVDGAAAVNPSTNNIALTTCSIPNPYNFAPRDISVFARDSSTISGLLGCLLRGYDSTNAQVFSAGPVSTTAAFLGVTPIFSFISIPDTVYFTKVYCSVPQARSGQPGLSGASGFVGFEASSD